MVSTEVKRAKTIQYIIHFTYLRRNITIRNTESLHCLWLHSLLHVLGPDSFVAGIGRVESAQAQTDDPGEKGGQHSSLKT